MASLLDLVDPFEAAAAKVQRRYPTRPPDPASLAASQGKAATWEQFLPSNERALQSAASLQAGGDYNPRDVFLSALGAVGTPGTPAGALGSSAGKGIRAYHGSPHDFERFDLSKIGTGEGAQAYGHGLYFAENPAVAGSYKAAGQPAYMGADRISAAQDLLKEAGGDRSVAVGLANERMTGTKKYGEGKLWQDVVNNFDQLVGKGPGRMYEVNINAQPEQFLDWNKMVAQQPAGMKLPGIYGPTQTGQGFYEALARGRPNPKFNPEIDPLGPTTIISHAGASNQLREAGIPGIKYLDQGSRAAGQGSSNYVLFRDDIISIIRKYGWAGLGLFGISPDDAKAAGVEKGQSNNLRIGNKTYGE